MRAAGWSLSAVHGKLPQVCGRYSDTAELSDVRLAFEAESELTTSWRPTYNISPSWGPGYEQLLVVARGGGGRSIRAGRFWFIPGFWQKPLKELPTAFNARADSLRSRAFFRGAFRSHRCLIPATGWREFVGGPGQKQPFHFHRSEPLFAFAGLWSSWIAPGGEKIDSFAIITTEPNAVAAEIHDRMPLVMPRSLYREWLDLKSDPDAVLAEAMSAGKTEPLVIFPSDPVGNNSRFEGPEVTQRIEAAPLLTFARRMPEQ